MRRGRLAMAAILAGGIAILAGCAAMPVPRSDDDSLVLFITENPLPHAGADQGPPVLRFDGPSAFQLDVPGDVMRVFFLRVRPGTYTLRTPGFTPPDAAAVIQVPAGSVVLSPFKLTRVTEAGARVRRLAPVNSTDQEKASAELTDYIDFGQWFGRAAVGFGASIPRLVPEQGNVAYTITSSPSGASVSIDDQPFGATPLTVTLRTGKHLLQLEIPDVGLTRTFVNVASTGSIDITLPVQAKQEVAEARERSQKRTILLSAFQNMGGAEMDNLSAIFPQVIRGDLRDDTRLVLVDAAALVARGGGIPGAPDFAEADRRGIDLIVSGYYLAGSGGLLVYAALYDVRTEIARSSITYTGKPGLSMFDSIDAMAADFIAGIDKVLPDVGKKQLDENAGAQSKIVTYEKKRSETELIARREQHKVSLALTEGPSIASWGSVHTPSFPGTLLTIFPLGIDIGYSLGNSFSLDMSFQPAVAFDTAGGAGVDPAASYVSVPYLDLPLRFGPAFTLQGYNVDLSFSILGELRYGQAYFDDALGNPVYGSRWIVGASFATTARAYLSQRLSEAPTFFLFGFNWFIVGLETNGDFSNGHLTPLELALTLGYGVRL